jgi:hypothetical protein
MPGQGTRAENDNLHTLPPDQELKSASGAHEIQMATSISISNEGLVHANGLDHAIGRVQGQVVRRAQFTPTSKKTYKQTTKTNLIANTVICLRSPYYPDGPYSPHPRLSLPLPLPIVFF